MSEEIEEFEEIENTEGIEDNTAGAWYEYDPSSGSETGIKQVLPDGITNIINNDGKLTMPATNNSGQKITKILYRAFLNRTELKELDLSEMTYLKEVQTEAFLGCSNLEKIIFPPSFNYLNSSGGIFDGCTSLTRIDFSSCTGLTTIPQQTFSKRSVTTDSNGNTVAADPGQGIFPSTGDGVTIILPSSITYIGSYAFAYVNFAPNGLQYKEHNVIKNGLSPNIKQVYNHAFYKSENLSIDVNLPNLTTLGTYAFAYSDIEGININLVSDYLCYYCENLEFAKFCTPHMQTVSKDAFAKCRSLTEVVLPDTITTIDKLAFAGCTALSKITLPKMLNTIEYTAFNGCRGLTELYLPKNVKYIKQSAFAYCNNLVYVSPFDSLIYLGEGAFTNTGVTELVFNWDTFKGFYVEGESGTLTEATLHKDGTSHSYVNIIMKSSSRDVSMSLPSGVGNTFSSGALFSDTSLRQGFKAVNFANNEYATYTGYIYPVSTASHTHSFKEKIIDAAYLKSPATCHSPAKYYYKCVYCAEKGKNTFDYGEPTGMHVFSDWTIATPPTADSTGTATRQCTEDGCTVSESMIVPKKIDKIISQETQTLTAKFTKTAKGTLISNAYINGDFSGEQGIGDIEKDSIKEVSYTLSTSNSLKGGYTNTIGGDLDFFDIVGNNGLSYDRDNYKILNNGSTWTSNQYKQVQLTLTITYTKTTLIFSPCTHPNTFYSVKKVGNCNNYDTLQKYCLNCLQPIEDSEIYEPSEKAHSYFLEEKTLNADKTTYSYKYRCRHCQKTEERRSFDEIDYIEPNIKNPLRIIYPAPGGASYTLQGDKLISVNSSNYDEIIIENSIRSIKAGSLSNCTNLKKLTIPSFKSISLYDLDASINPGEPCLSVLFSINNCISISSHAKNPFSSSDTYTRIPNNSVYPISLKEVCISGNDSVLGMTNAYLKRVDYIPPFAFYGMTNLERVYIGKGIWDIRDYAFFNCSNLIRIDGCKDLLRVRYRVFEGANKINRGQNGWETGTNIRRIIINDNDIDPNDNDKSERRYILSRCTPYIKTSNTNYGDSDNPSKYSYNRHRDGDFQVIQDYAFIPPTSTASGTTGISSIDLTDCQTLKGIGGLVFKDLTSLQILKLPKREYNSMAADWIKNVEYIGYQILDGCTSLKTLTVPYIGSRGDYPANNKDNMMSFSEFFFGTTTAYPALKDITVWGTKRINKGAFYNEQNIENLKIPYSKQIGYKALQGCLGLKYLAINSPWKVNASSHTETSAVHNARNSIISIFSDSVTPVEKTENGNIITHYMPDFTWYNSNTSFLNTITFYETGSDYDNSVPDGFLYGLKYIRTLNLNDAFKNVGQYNFASVPDSVSVTINYSNPTTLNIYDKHNPIITSKAPINL